MTNPIRDISLDEAQELLKACGLRRTFTRICLLQCLARQSAPMTHADISRALAAHGLDDSTIFRGLSDLVEARLIVRLDLGDRTWRFELRSLPGASDWVTHPHIVCRLCGGIECLDGFRDVPKRQVPGWTIDEVLFKGVCQNCREQTSTEVADPQ